MRIHSSGESLQPTPKQSYYSYKEGEDGEGRMAIVGGLQGSSTLQSYPLHCPTLHLQASTWLYIRIRWLLYITHLYSLLRSTLHGFSTFLLGRPMGLAKYRLTIANYRLNNGLPTLSSLSHYSLKFINYYMLIC